MHDVCEYDKPLPVGYRIISRWRDPALTDSDDSKQLKETRKPHKSFANHLGLHVNLSRRNKEPCRPPWGSGLLNPNVNHCKSWVVIISSHWATAGLEGFFIREFFANFPHTAQNWTLCEQLKLSNGRSERSTVPGDFHAFLLWVSTAILIPILTQYVLYITITVYISQALWIRQNENTHFNQQRELGTLEKPPWKTSVCTVKSKIVKGSTAVLRLKLSRSSQNSLALLFWDWKSFAFGV